MEQRAGVGRAPASAPDCTRADTPAYLRPRPSPDGQCSGLRPDVRRAQRQAPPHRRCQSNQTRKAPSDVFGQEDGSSSQSAGCWGGRGGAGSDACSSALCSLLYPLTSLSPRGVGVGRLSLRDRRKGRALVCETGNNGGGGVFGVSEEMRRLFPISHVRLTARSKVRVRDFWTLS